MSQFNKPENTNPIFEYERQILEQNLDCFGHMNNAMYLVLYEEARWDFITKNGMGLDYIMKNQIGPVLLDLNLVFKAEIKNREKIKILSQCLSMKNKYVMTLEQRMFKEDGKLASVLTISCGLMDLKERKLINPPDEWLKVLGFNLETIERM